MPELRIVWVKLPNFEHKEAKEQEQEKTMFKRRTEKLYKFLQECKATMLFYGDCAYFFPGRLHLSGSCCISLSFIANVESISISRMKLYYGYKSQEEGLILMEMPQDKSLMAPSFEPVTFRLCLSKPVQALKPKATFISRFSIVFVVRCLKRRVRSSQRSGHRILFLLGHIIVVIGFHCDGGKTNL